MFNLKNIYIKEEFFRIIIICLNKLLKEMLEC